MVLRTFYMKSIDEINAGNPTLGEIQVRQIAKNVSVLPTFIVFALFLPLLMILYYCHENSGRRAHTIVFNFFIKPTRWVSYTIVYLLCSLVRIIIPTK
jgi:hypothetical protein